MTRKHLLENVVAYLAEHSSKGLRPIGAYTIATKLGEKRPTVNRYLARLVSSGTILREGDGPATTHKISRPDTLSFQVSDRYPKASAISLAP